MSRQRAFMLVLSAVWLVVAAANSNKTDSRLAIIVSSVFLATSFIISYMEENK